MHQSTILHAPIQSSAVLLRGRRTEGTNHMCTTNQHEHRRVLRSVDLPERQRNGKDRCGRKASGTMGVSSAWNRAPGLRTVKSIKSDTPTHQMFITKRLPLLFHTGTDGSVPPRSATSVNIVSAEGPSDYVALRLFPEFFYVIVPHTNRTRIVCVCVCVCAVKRVLNGNCV